MWSIQLCSETPWQLNKRKSGAQKWKLSKEQEQERTKLPILDRGWQTIAGKQATIELAVVNI